MMALLDVLWLVILILVCIPISLMGLFVVCKVAAWSITYAIYDARNRFYLDKKQKEESNE